MEQLYFKGQNYAVSVGNDTFSVFAGDEQFFELSVRSAVHTSEQRDLDHEVMQRTVEENSKDSLAVIWTTCSAPTNAGPECYKPAWEKKVYRLEAKADGFLYNVSVTGKGTPAGVGYFTDTTGKSYGSTYDASWYLLPVACNNNLPEYPKCITADSVIDLGYFAPPMYCYPFGMEDAEKWLGLGLAAKPGEYHFTEFHYKNAGNRFWLSVPYEGHTKVDGTWEAPGILGCAGDNGVNVLENYSKWHYDHGYTTRRHPAEEDPAWWSGPFMCGWGEQCSAVGKLSCDPYVMATQEFYEGISQKLDEKGLRPTAIIIDDKWQLRYGEAMPDKEKWPDLRKFVDEQHEKGRKVVLWFKTWNHEGLDADECVDMLCQPYCADPTTEKYRKRVQEIMRRLLSDEEGCYNCDGFKFDFLNCAPLGRLVRAKEASVYGVELVHRMMELLYRSVKAIKPDALVNCSCCHPYFAEFTDQARLHDYDHSMRSQKMTMRFRKNLFKAAIPEVSIDTDGVSSLSRREAMQYIRYSPELGVPDLYEFHDVLTEEDWEEVRKIWETYSASLKK